jgi:hypothetical protein
MEGHTDDKSSIVDLLMQCGVAHLGPECEYAAEGCIGSKYRLGCGTREVAHT